MNTTIRGIKRALTHPFWILPRMNTAISTHRILGKSKFPWMMSSMPCFSSNPPTSDEPIDEEEKIVVEPLTETTHVEMSPNTLATKEIAAETRIKIEINMSAAGSKLLANIHDSNGVLKKYGLQRRQDMEVATLGERSQEAGWLRNLLGDVPLWGSTVPMSLHYDSQAAIGIAKNYSYNDKWRHGAVKKLLKNGIIFLDYVRSERNLADPLTKRLTRIIIFQSSEQWGPNP
ncbi:UNVERIFIED_CONTAM: hypothetical protein Scaly_0863400 [Sesamum calycinum]|uniref:Uncharacterized protein n=1 Tax=Sesamum calycinum TaxID=2727403 RepID=A0AAW2QVM7_9LAMI